MHMNNRKQVDEGYTENLVLWRQIRAAIEGKPGVMRLLESENGYFGLVTPAYCITQVNVAEKRRHAYFCRGRFLNFTGETHATYMGMVGGTKVDYHVPESMELFMEEVDGEDSTIDDFANKMMSEVLITARYGILVDPQDTNGMTVAEAEKRHPKFIGYKAEQMTNPIVDQGMLVQLDLHELYWAMVDGEYKQKKRIRRLRLIDGVFSPIVIDEDGGEKELTVMIKGKTLTYIPFHFVGAQDNKADYNRPIMFDLAHQNLGHFMLDCDNRENLFYHAQGMMNMFIGDAQQVNADNVNGIGVGAAAQNYFGQSDKVEIIQIEATGALPAEMLRDENRMIMLGAQVVQDKVTNQTLGGEVIEANATTSKLKLSVNNGSAALTCCARWAAEMMGVTESAVKDIHVTVNNRFATDSMTSLDVTAIFAMYSAGAATLDELSEAKRRAGYTQLSNEELKDALDESGITGNTEEVATLQMQLDAANAEIAELTGKSVPVEDEELPK